MHPLINLMYWAIMYWAKSAFVCLGTQWYSSRLSFGIAICDKLVANHISNLVGSNTASYNAAFRAGNSQEQFRDEMEPMYQLLL